MKSAKLIGALFLVLFLIGVGSAQAETVLRVGDDVAISPDQVIGGNYYVAAGMFGSTAMSGQVEEDMIAIGRSVTITGDIGHDLLVLAAIAQIHGRIGDDARFVAGEVTIADAVEGDLVMVGGTLKVLPSAEIGGDVFFFGSRADLAGSIAGSVFGTADRWRLDGEVSGNVEVRAVQGLVLTDRTVVAGNLSYSGATPLSRAPGAVVEGQLTENNLPGVAPLTQAEVALVPILILLFATLTLYLLCRRELERQVKITSEAFALSGFIGLGTLVFGPLFALLLIATVLGSLVGIMGLALLVVLFTIALALTSVTVGAVLARLFGYGYKLSLWWILAGQLTIFCLLLIPILGGLVFLVAFCITLGGLVTRLYSSY